MAMRDLIVRNGDGRPRRRHRRNWRGWPALASSGMTMLQDARRRLACIVGNGEARERSPAVAGLSL